MFRLLKKPEHTEDDEDNGSEFQNLGDFEDILATDDADKAVEELRDLAETYSNLILVRNAIEQHGLNKTVLAIIDHDKALSSVIPAFPSLESLTEDISGENAKFITDALDVATESVFGKIRDTLKRIGEKIKFVFSGWNDRYRQLEERLKRAEEQAKGKHFDAEKLEQVKFRGTKEHDFLESLKHFHGIYEHIAKAYNVPLPIHEESHHYMVEIDKILGEHVTMTHHANHQPMKMTLKAGGYSEASIHPLHEAMLALMHEHQSKFAEVDKLTDKFIDLCEVGTTVHVGNYVSHHQHPIGAAAEYTVDKVWHLEVHVYREVLTAFDILEKLFHLYH